MILNRVARGNDFFRMEAANTLATTRRGFQAVTQSNRADRRSA